MSRIAELQRQLAQAQADSEARQQQTPSGSDGTGRVNSVAAGLALNFNPMTMAPGARPPKRASSDEQEEERKEDGAGREEAPSMTHLARAKSTSRSKRAATRSAFVPTHTSSNDQADPPSTSEARNDADSFDFMSSPLDDLGDAPSPSLSTPADEAESVQPEEPASVPIAEVKRSPERKRNAYVSPQQASRELEHADEQAADLPPATRRKVSVSLSFSASLQLSSDDDSDLDLGGPEEESSPARRSTQPPTAEAAAPVPTAIDSSDLPSTQETAAPDSPIVTTTGDDDLDALFAQDHSVEDHFGHHDEVEQVTVAASALPEPASEPEPEQQPQDEPASVEAVVADSTESAAEAVDTEADVIVADPAEESTVDTADEVGGDVAEDEAETNGVESTGVDEASSTSATKAGASWHAQAAARAKEKLKAPTPAPVKSSSMGVSVVAARSAQDAARKERIVEEAKALAPKAQSSTLHEPTVCFKSSVAATAAVAAEAEAEEETRQKRETARAKRVSADGTFQPTKIAAFSSPTLEVATAATLAKRRRAGESWSADEAAVAAIRNLDFGAPPPKEEGRGLFPTAATKSPSPSKMQQPQAIASPAKKAPSAKKKSTVTAGEETEEEAPSTGSASSKKKPTHRTQLSASDAAIVDNLSRSTSAAVARNSQKAVPQPAGAFAFGGSVATTRADPDAPAKAKKLARPQTALPAVSRTATAVAKPTKAAEVPAAKPRAKPVAAVAARPAIARTATAMPAAAAVKPKAPVASTSAKKKVAAAPVAVPKVVATARARPASASVGSSTARASTTTAATKTPTKPKDDATKAPAASPPSGIKRPASASAKKLAAAPVAVKTAPAVAKTATSSKMKPPTPIKAPTKVAAATSGSATARPASARPSTAATKAAPKAAPAATAAKPVAAKPVAAKKVAALSTAASKPSGLKPPTGAVLKGKGKTKDTIAATVVPVREESPAPVASSPAPEAIEGIYDEAERERRVQEIRKAKLASKIKTSPIAGEESASSPASTASSSPPTAAASAVTQVDGAAALALAATTLSPVGVDDPTAWDAIVTRVPRGSLSSHAGHGRKHSGHSLARHHFAHQRLLMEMGEVFDWLSRVVEGSRIVLTNPVEPDSLFAAIENGAVLCGLVARCQAIALEKCGGDVAAARALSGPPVTFKLEARLGSFVARDNLANFLSAVEGWGLPRQQLFEPDDLVLRKNDKQVIQSLLDISRLCFARFGITPPDLIQFEFDIATEEQEAPPTPPLPELPPPPMPAEPTGPPPPRYLPYRPVPGDALDAAVAALVNGHQLDIYISRVKAGQYFIGDLKDPKVRLVRHLVLVRVGGGWESFLACGERKFEAQASEEAKAMAQAVLSGAATASVPEEESLDEY